MAPTCSSDETSSAPVSIACAAIQMSFVGIGRPFARSAAAMKPRDQRAVEVGAGAREEVRVVQGR